MVQENKQNPERVSLFSAKRASVRDNSAEPTVVVPADVSDEPTVVVEKIDESTIVMPAQPTAEDSPTEADTVVTSPYDPPRSHAQLTAQTEEMVGLPESIANTSIATDSEENEAEAMKRKNAEEAKKKKMLIGAGIAGVLAIIYFSGVFIYSGRFFPHTTFGAIDVSNHSFDDAVNVIDESEQDYSLTVTGQGLDFVVTPAESGMDIDAKQIVDAARTKVNPWTWPIQLFKRHDLVKSADITLDDSALGNYINQHVITFNENHTASKNARIEYDTKSDTWVIVPEVYGEQLDKEKVMALVTSCIFNRKDECAIGSNELLAPTAHAKDDNVVKGAKSANALMGVDAEFISPVADGVLGTLDSDLLSQWVTFDNNFAPSLNQEALSAWAVEMSRPLSTVGATRNYTRADGKKVTVSGGNFGCSVSEEVATEAVNKAITEKKHGAISLERQCFGTQAEEGSETEWGSYVDVDLTEQRARYYDASGKIMWESGVVSGNVSEGHSTPTGVWYVNNKQRNQTLRGPKDENGEPEWESEVSYWMPFVGNSVGLHDASWRGAGEFNDPGRYRTAGSHGCVNLPMSSASSLYSKIAVGTPVVVHK